MRWRGKFSALGHNQGSGKIGVIQSLGTVREQWGYVRGFWLSQQFLINLSNHSFPCYILPSFAICHGLESLHYWELKSRKLLDCPKEYKTICIVMKYSTSQKFGHTLSFKRLGTFVQTFWLVVYVITLLFITRLNGLNSFSKSVAQSYTFLFLALEN